MGEEGEEGSSEKDGSGGFSFVWVFVLHFTFAPLLLFCSLTGELIASIASSIDSGSRAASLRPFDFCFFHCDLLSLLFYFFALRRVRRHDSLEPLTQCRIKEKCVKPWVASRRHRMDIGGIVRHACGRSFPSFMLRSRRSVASRPRRTGR